MSKIIYALSFALFLNSCGDNQDDASILSQAEINEVQELISLDLKSSFEDEVPEDIDVDTLVSEVLEEYQKELKDKEEVHAKLTDEDRRARIKAIVERILARSQKVDTTPSAEEIEAEKKRQLQLKHFEAIEKSLTSYAKDTEDEHFIALVNSKLEEILKVVYEKLLLDERDILDIPERELYRLSELHMLRYLQYKDTHDDTALGEMSVFAKMYRDRDLYNIIISERYQNYVENQKLAYVIFLIKMSMDKAGQEYRNVDYTAVSEVVTPLYVQGYFTDIE